MAKDKVDLYLGAMLHDVGKIVFRGASEAGTHSQLGARFFEQEVASRNSDLGEEVCDRVAEQIRFHHGKELNSATGLEDSSLAYITYFADNISAGMDRKNEGDSTGGQRFDKDVDLRKIFNILNGRHDDGTIPHDDYNSIRERIKRELAGIDPSLQGMNSVLNLLESTTSSVPSSTDKTQLIDVSFYDHAKTTAGIAACVYDYLRDCGVTNFREALFDSRASSRYCAAPMFLLCSCDMSGIQDFIYNISGKGALKQLRSRSLYLEILLEHIVDELLDRLDLCRANLLYTGGGHAYLLLPNTEESKECLKDFSNEVRDWFVDRFRTDLFLAMAWVECSADDLGNKGDDERRYSNLYRKLAARLSDAKASRYSAKTLRDLNFSQEAKADHSRECTECHRADVAIFDEGSYEGKCPMCASLGQISKAAMEKEVFVIEESVAGASGGERGLYPPLPFDCRLAVYSRDSYLAKKPTARRVYTKNSWDMGLNLATHIWMGDYSADTHGMGIEAYDSRSATLGDRAGIKRLGVLRADVDDLGAAFVSGFPVDKASISRTATLSRNLSYFFKFEINEVLAKKGYQAQIIYSGGDDLFVVGNWSDVIHAAVDIRNAFGEFTGNDALTISAGIGMFDSHYPIARVAEEVGELEDAAKLHGSEGETGAAKNSVALWTSESVFFWEEFVDCVLPRIEEVRRAFEGNEKGKAFVYRLMALLRDFDNVISVPRLAYLLARSFDGQKDDGAETSKKFYEWALDSKERRYLIAAIEYYVYSIRERG